MELKETVICGRKCFVGTHGEGTPEYLLVQAIDEHEAGFLGNETAVIEKSNVDFAFAAFQVNSWNYDLSPWEAPPVFVDEPFGDGAEETLRYITGELIPEVSDMLGLGKNVKVLIGGYSLSAFFALWCVLKSDVFAGASASSPSVWFPGWIVFLEDHAGAISEAHLPIYLSLGNKEARTRNPVMQTVADRIEETEKILRERANCDVVLEWNQGNHFKEPDVRTAKGFVWLIERGQRAAQGNDALVRKTETANEHTFSTF